jgi:choline monooxygenase
MSRSVSAIIVAMRLDDYQPTANLAAATTIPARWYTDPAFLDLERERVFWGTWQVLGHAGKVAAPGQYFSAEITGEPVVVARGRDGVLRAFSNVCRHRAAAIISEPGCGNVLRCPYHGWTYQLDGRLLGTPEFAGAENWDRTSVRLPEYRVEEWGPFVFVNVDGAAPPLRDVLGDIPRETAEIGCDVGHLQFSYRRDYLIDCNWKVYIDNYLEGYHLPTAHPGLFRELDYAAYRVDTFRWYSSQYAPIRAAAAGEKRQYDESNAGNRALYYWVFPNFMLNIYPDNLSSNIILPVGHDKTLTIFEWFGYGGAPVKDSTVEFSDEIQQEDIRICEAVQKGLGSRTYSTGRFSPQRENGVHHFHLLLDQALRRE